MGARCRVCGDPKTVRSHLIPKAFVKMVRGDDPHALMTDLERETTTTTRGGVFDDGILCSTHEDALKRFDDYAIRFCRRVADTSKPKDYGGFIVREVNCDLLCGFALSVLWRCHHSDRVDVRDTQLGKYADLIENVVFHGGSNERFPVYFYVPVSDELDVLELGSVPAKKSIEGVTRWSFLAGGVDFIVDVGNGRASFRQHAINGKSDALGFTMPLEAGGMRDGWLAMARIAARTPSLLREPRSPG